MTFSTRAPPCAEALRTNIMGAARPTPAAVSDSFRKSRRSTGFPTGAARSDRWISTAFAFFLGPLFLRFVIRSLLTYLALFKAVEERNSAGTRYPVAHSFTQRCARQDRAVVARCPFSVVRCPLHQDNGERRTGNGERPPLSVARSTR